MKIRQSAAMAAASLTGLLCWAAAQADSLTEGWNSIEPGGDTVCSDGSGYRFFVRPGDSRKLVVYFQGGGACWFAGNCDTHLEPSYKPRVAEDEPERYRGIFEFDNPDNPFADYSVVMAPYCTADVHLGDNVATYAAPAGEDHQPHPVTIRHKGLINAQAVLDWTYEHFSAPAEIFVTGSSAGAIPSPYYAWKIADHYTDARIAQLGDGAGGYRRSAADTSDRLARWGTLEHLAQYPEFADMTEAEFTYEHLYIAAAKRHPQILFAEYDAAEDAVQKRFLAMSGADTATLRDLLLANHADIRAEVDNFRAYVAGGDSHTILARPEFYTFQVDGRRIRDWVADLAAFRDVSDVVCRQCAEAELTAGATPGNP
ncbi:MAG: pectin acetylesterase-family hydrolase [Gammaproteobacteria bacterium]|nr:pectin acetylesterase-family hydrolase [Gammaproteobacteria bacterium]